MEFTISKYCIEIKLLQYFCTTYVFVNKQCSETTLSLVNLGRYVLERSPLQNIRYFQSRLITEVVIGYNVTVTCTTITGLVYSIPNSIEELQVEFARFMMVCMQFKETLDRSLNLVLVQENDAAEHLRNLHLKLIILLKT